MNLPRLILLRLPAALAFLFVLQFAFVRPADAQMDLIYVQSYRTVFDYTPPSLIVETAARQLSNAASDADQLPELTAADRRAEARELLLQYSAQTNETDWKTDLLYTGMAAWLGETDRAAEILDKRVAVLPAGQNDEAYNAVSLARAVLFRDAGKPEEARKQFNNMLRLSADDRSATYEKRRLHLLAAKQELELKAHDAALAHLRQVTAWFRLDSIENPRDLLEPTPATDKKPLPSHPADRLQYTEALCLEAELHLSLFYRETHDVRNLLRADHLYRRALMHFEDLRHSAHGATLFPLLQELGNILFVRALGASYMAFQETGLEEHAHEVFRIAELRKQFNFWRGALLTMPFSAHRLLSQTLQTWQQSAVDASRAAFDSPNGNIDANLQQKWDRAQDELRQSPRRARIFTRKSPPSISAVLKSLADSTLFLHYSICEQQLYTARFFRGEFSLHRSRVTQKLRDNIVTAYESMRTGRSDDLPDALQFLFQSLLAQHLRAENTFMQHLVVSPDSTLFSIPFEALAARADVRRGKPGDFTRYDYTARHLSVEYAYCAADLLQDEQQAARKDGNAIVVSPLSEEPTDCDGISAEARRKQVTAKLGTYARLHMFNAAGENYPLRYAERELQALRDQLEEEDADLSEFINCDASREHLAPQQDEDVSLAAWLTHLNYCPGAPEFSGLLLAPDNSDSSGFLHLSQFADYSPDAEILVLPYCDLRNGELVDAVSAAAMLSNTGTREHGYTAFSLWTASTSFSFEFLQAFARAAENPSGTAVELQNLRQKFIDQERLAHPLRWARLVLYRY